MTREDYIKALIKSNGYTLKDFAKLIQMPYTTLLSILNGSIGGAAMDNVLKICNALNIKMEQLENLSDDTQTPQQESSAQTGVDAHLLRLIRELSPEKQIALKLLLSKHI